MYEERPTSTSILGGPGMGRAAEPNRRTVTLHGVAEFIASEVRSQLNEVEACIETLQTLLGVTAVQDTAPPSSERSPPIVSPNNAIDNIDDYATNIHARLRRASNQLHATIARINGG